MLQTAGFRSQTSLFLAATCTLSSLPKPRSNCVVSRPFLSGRQRRFDEAVLGRFVTTSLQVGDGHEDSQMPEFCEIALHGACGPPEQPGHIRDARIDARPVVVPDIGQRRCERFKIGMQIRLPDLARQEPTQSALHAALAGTGARAPGIAPPFDGRPKKVCGDFMSGRDYRILAVCWGMMKFRVQKLCQG